MNARAYYSALAYERKVGTQPDIPDARLGIGAAEDLSSKTKQQFVRMDPGKAKTAAVKTDDDIMYIGDNKSLTQSDFINSGYIGEVL